MADRFTAGSNFKQVESSAERTGAREPDGYAYRYPSPPFGTVIRFNNGKEVNGAAAVEAVPYFLGKPPEPSALERECSRLREELGLLDQLVKEIVAVGKPYYVDCDDIGVKDAGWKAVMPKLSQWLSICAKAVRCKGQSAPRSSPSPEETALRVVPLSEKGESR